MRTVSTGEFKARLYRRGSGEAEPVTAAVGLGVLHVRGETSGDAAIPLEEVELKLGGTNEDRIVLSLKTSGDTIVSTDHKLLDALAASESPYHLSKQIRKARLAKFTRLFRQSSSWFLPFIIFGTPFVIILIALLVILIAEEPGSERTQQEKAPGVESRDKARSEDAEAAYQADLEARLKKAWHPPRAGKSTLLKVHFDIQRDGNITNLEVAKSSGVKAMDAAGLQAVRAAAPFRPFPEDWPDSVPVDFTFEYRAGGK